MSCEPLESINYESIIINEAVKNSVLQYNNFYKLIYSTNIVVLTSIFIIFELTHVTIENDSISFNKNNTNFEVFNKLIALEEYLLKLINSHKNKLYKFKEIYGNIKSDIIFIHEIIKKIKANFPDLYLFNLNSSNVSVMLTQHYDAEIIKFKKLSKSSKEPPADYDVLLWNKLKKVNSRDFFRTEFMFYFCMKIKQIRLNKKDK